MNRIRATIVILIIMSIGSSGIVMLSCKKKPTEGVIIFTRVAGKTEENDYVTGNSWRYIPQSMIVSTDPGRHGDAPKVLTEGFYSACSPQISYDGSNMLFTGQQKQNDLWQIWEMNLASSKIRQITSASENCTDPDYLPDGRIVFSKSDKNDKFKAGHSLYTCNADGSKLTRITYNPDTYLASTLLKDGRVITISRQLYPEVGNQLFMVMRPDGTKAELFYEGVDGCILINRARETENGKIVFIESDNKNQNSGNIISISYNRPLHTHVNLTSGINGEFNNVFPLPSGMMLVSYRPSEKDRFALYEFDPEKKVLGKTIYYNPDYDVLDAVLVRRYNRPKKLPSEVDMGVKTGLLLCQDIDISDLQTTGSASPTVKASGIEVIGIDSSLGVVQAEKDGSIYLKVIADKPFKLRRVDENGRILGRSCDWIWIRPNERRGCVGCHEDHEMVPENRVPLAVKMSPVLIPVHKSKLKEKAIELE